MANSEASKDVKNKAPLDEKALQAAKMAQIKLQQQQQEQDEQLELVLLRNNFYRDSFHKVMWLCVMLCSIIVIMVAYIYYLQESKPKDRFFATSMSGSLTRLVPLDTPNLTPSSLLSWAQNAISAAYTFNFVNFRKSIQDAKMYFSERGYINYVNALQEAGTINALTEKKLIVSAVPTGVPVVLQEGIFGKGNNGEPLFAWKVQVPVLISYQSSSDEVKQNVVINMTIIRMPTLESENGVGIDNFTVIGGKI